MAGPTCAPVGAVGPSGDALCVVRRELRCLTRGLERVYNVSLPVPVFTSLASVKEFCSGLLGPCGRNHLWFRPISQLRLKDRLSISGSLFLFRKVLPASPPSLSGFIDRMTAEAVPPPPGFMGFISSEMKRMFPRGWDRGWKGRVLGTTVRSSSCLENSRGKGGARGLLAEQEWIDRAQFCRELCDLYSPFRPNVDRVRLMYAMCDGKQRIVSVNSVDMTVLAPFHTLVYDRISTFDWCLRGEATANRFRDFVSRPGEVFVSGDYESASDNLNPDVARHILGSLSRSCTRVPLFVREAALKTLSCVAESELGTHVLNRQLMGNSMCFPLLCLQNYLAFKFLVRREVPVKINGDDIVFRCTRGEYRVWSEGVRSCGLCLSVGKTAVEPRWFSLNSTFFTAGRRHVRLAPVVRSTVLFKGLETPVALAGRVETFRGFSPPVRDRLVCWLLRRFAKSVWGSQVSLRRGLGVRVSERQLRLSRLYERESFYLSLSDRQDPVYPLARDGYFLSSVPDGWRRVFRQTRIDQDSQRAFRRELVESSWQPVVRKGKVSGWFVGPVAFVARPTSARHARLLGVSVKRLCALVPIRNLPERKECGRPRWVRDGKVSADEPRPRAWENPVVFSRAGFA